MRRLGKPLLLSAQNHLIIQTNFSPPIGSRVFNQANNAVGEIIDVFGPINSPFISIKSKTKINLSNFLNNDLFINLSQFPQKDLSKKRRGKRFGSR